MNNDLNSNTPEKEIGFPPISIPVLQYSSNDFLFDLADQESVERSELNPKKTFKSLLRERWEMARAEGAFNYNLNCVYRNLGGDFNMDMQLNVDRGELRRKPLKFEHIKEPFDSTQWNFTKLLPKEILFYLKSTDTPNEEDCSTEHIVAVNASPLERDHSLIVPSVNKCYPQVLTPTAIQLGVDVMLMVDDIDFNILFNSVLGQASVNHLHLHCLYWPYKSDLIYRKFSKLGNSEVYVIEPPKWLCQAFAFQLKSKDDYQQFNKNLTCCTKLLSDAGQAHNIFMTRAPTIRTDGPDWEKDAGDSQPSFVTAYVFPRKNMIGAKPPTNFNPAANELAGCLTSYTKEFYETANEAMCVSIIREEATLSEQVFRELSQSLQNHLNSS
ncbi:unnamed protein product [Auanema sp. JU1783]|nr:unnamed protein product [Auanema sp. JU1783]